MMMIVVVAPEGERGGRRRDDKSGGEEQLPTQCGGVGLLRVGSGGGSGERVQRLTVQLIFVHVSTVTRCKPRK